MSLLGKAARPVCLLALMLGTALPDGAHAQTAGPGQPDPYAFVLASMGPSRDEAGKALCEQHIAVVKRGLPDPGRRQNSSSRFAATAERAEMLQMLYMGARTTNDPSEAMANVLVLLSMLEGASYPEAVAGMMAAEAAQATHQFDCTQSYAAQAIGPAFASSRRDVDVERDRQQYLDACAEKMSESQLRDEQSRALDTILDSISHLYQKQLTPLRGQKPLGASSSGDSNPPRYLATWTDRQGKVHTEPLTGEFLSKASKAHTSGDTRDAAIDSLNTGVDIYNGVLGFASGVAGRRLPYAGIAAAPNASILGTLTSAVENLNGALALGGKGSAGLATTAKAAGWIGLVIQLLEPKDAVTPTQYDANSLAMLHPDSKTPAQRVDVVRSQETLSKTLGADVKISESPINQSKPFQPEDPPLMCPVGPKDPFNASSGYVDCDAGPGSVEPAIPVACQAVMADAKRQIHGGYEWAPEEYVSRNPFAGKTSGYTQPCDDTGKNPSHCTAPEPVGTPIDEYWDGKHWDEDSENARGRLSGIKRP